MSIGSQGLKYKTNLFKSWMDEPFNPATELSLIVKVDQTQNIFDFFRNVRIPNTQYIFFWKMIQYHIPNSTIRLLLFE